MRRSLLRAAGAAATLAIVLGASNRARADVYLSLGDSRGFGTGEDQRASSYGVDQGYTAPFAAYLASVGGGIAPTVLNLSVPGETGASFFDGSGRIGPDNRPPTADEDAALVALNRNYAASGGVYPTQNAMLLQALATYGPAVTHVTISLGADDLFKLVLTDPTNARDELPATLTAFAQDLGTIVGEIKTFAPGAQVVLVGAYDPYPPGTPGEFAALAGPAIDALNQTIRLVAAAFPASANVGFADTSDLFTDHLLTDTYIASGNVHPTPGGYALIAGAIEAVPEPTTFALTALGAAGALVFRRSRKPAART